MIQIPSRNDTASNQQNHNPEPSNWPRIWSAHSQSLSKHSELASIQQFVDDLDAAWTSNENDASVDISTGSHQEDGGSAKFGRFVLHQTLGEGGFGVVFQAFDPVLGREIALKLPRAEAWASVELRERFLREGQAAASLSHPNILPVLEAGVIGGVGYIVSMLCSGPTLARWIAESNQRCSPQTVAWVTLCLARAVHHAHERGVLHRDIKPSNVLLEPNPDAADGLSFIPRLTDFGLAKHLNNATPETAAHLQVGTPRYMAPEQLATLGASDVGVFTDIYALGVVLYELLTGHVPFDSSNHLELARLIHDVEPSGIRSIRPEVSRDLETICLKCLQKKPAERYPSAAALADDLQRYLAGDEVMARPLRWGTKWLRRCQRHKLVAALIAAVLLSVAAGIAGVAHQSVTANRYAATVEQSFEEAEQGLVNMAWVLQEVSLGAESTDPFQDGYRESLLAHYRRMLARPAPSRPSLSYLATMESFRARAAEIANQEDEAARRFEKSIDLWKDLVHRYPANDSYRQALVLNMFSSGAHLRRYGHEKHPLAEMKNPQPILDYCLEMDPQNGDVPCAYVSFLIDRGKDLMRLDQGRESHHYFHFAQRLSERIETTFPDNITCKRASARAFFYLACSHRRMSAQTEAIYYFTKANQSLDQVMTAASATSDDLLMRADASRLQAACMRDERHTNDAITMFETAQHFLLKLTPEVAETPRVWNLRASIHENLAELYQSQGQPTRSRLNWEQFCEATQKSLDVSCALNRMTSKFPMVLHQLGTELQQEGRLSEAANRFEEACNAFERVDALLPESNERRQAWADCSSRLADCRQTKQP